MMTTIVKNATKKWFILIGQFVSLAEEKVEANKEIFVGTKWIRVCPTCYSEIAKTDANDYSDIFT